MDKQLLQRIGDLVIEYIFAESQDTRSGRDIDKIVEITSDIQSINDLRDIFEKDSYLYRSSSLYRDKYRIKLHEILRHEVDSEKLSSDSEIKQFQRYLLKELLGKLLHEKSITTKSYRVSKLEDEVTELEEKIRYAKFEGKVTMMDKLKSIINLPYLIVLSILIISLIGIYILSSKATLNITVNFSIGEIIGAILAGTGIAVAGISYATKKPENQNQNRG